MHDPRHDPLGSDLLAADPLALDAPETLQWLGHLQRLASTGLLAGGMAHDLAGLVQPLLSEAERALLQDDESDYREALVAMRMWARRCQTYVRALLDLVRRDERHRVAVPVERVIEDTLELLASTQRDAGVSIVRHLDNRHVALADRTRLMQAVVNLVTNAIRAAAAGGREVAVTVQGERDGVVIEVADNGPGVPEAIRTHLFRPFVHGEPAGEAGPVDARRTGLGLYITKRLIEEQGGRIGYETASGVGTTFRIVLEPAMTEGEGHTTCPEE